MGAGAGRRVRPLAGACEPSGGVVPSRRAFERASTEPQATHRRQPQRARQGARSPLPIYHAVQRVVANANQMPVSMSTTLGVQVLRQVILVLTGKILRTFGTTYEVARRKRIQLVTSMCDLSRVHEIQRAYQNIARTLARQRLNFPEPIGLLVVEPYIDPHFFPNNAPRSPANIACRTPSYNATWFNETFALSRPNSSPPELREPRWCPRVLRPGLHIDQDRLAVGV